MGEVRPTWRYWLLWLPNRLVMRLLFDIRAEGLDHLPEPPYQLVVNHHNGFDPMFLMAATPPIPRITFFGPKEVDFSRGFKNRVMGFFGGTVPYRPGRGGLTEAVRMVRRVFAANGVLAIFAEGRIGFRETELLPFQEGASFFAAEARVPVVPCAVVGSTHLWFRAPVTIRFGQPITLDATDRAARQELDRRVRDAVAALLPDEEPRLPHRRPLSFLTDLLNGRDDVDRRRHGA